MRTAGWIAVASCCVALVACRSGTVQSGAAALGATSMARTGTLTGVVKLYGGPFSSVTGKQTLNGAPAPDWRVTVRSGSRVVARETSNTSGRFVFHLMPGTYVLDCSGAQPIQILAGTTTTADCPEPVP